ncbi:SAVED domain-containing protein [Granulosicoccus sp.]|nr:SAVED domain-containing protein [Granulosicoccus sp.]MDB4222789.1 SAVED domain-containing protein [Granulosicoccus sp.]
MTQAVTARRDGDTYQARQFWLYAGRLLDPDSPIVRVGFESGPKSFDDIWIEYAPGREPNDSSGRPLERVHIQCKWHVSLGTYGFSDLVNPEFINASTRSLLQRARDSQLKYAPLGSGAQFKLVTNWQPDRADPLASLISSRSGSVRPDRLFGTKTDNSRVGRVRKLWREHLDIEEDELRLFINTLAFGHTSESLDDLRERLGELFTAVGLRRVPVHETAFVYDDLIFGWMSQGRLEFDRSSFKALCTKEGLIGQAPIRKAKVYGIKSFEHAFDRLEDRADKVLDFVPVFEKRFIRDDADWEETLYPELSEFLSAAARDGPKLRLALDAHTTLAFAAGSVLNIKSGRHVELEQRIISRAVWAADDLPVDPNWPIFEQKTVDLKPNAPDIAVALGITHDITADVSQYVEKQLPSVGRLLILRPSTGSGSQVVRAGRHAFDLAQSAQEAIRSAQVEYSVDSVSHVFIAAPNALTFFLGQLAPVLGRVRLYEFDFEGGSDRSYSPSLTLPVLAK